MCFVSPGLFSLTLFLFAYPSSVVILIEGHSVALNKVETDDGVPLNLRL